MVGTASSTCSHGPSSDQSSDVHRPSGWAERWIESRILHDLNLILSGARPGRLGPAIGRLLEQELPAAGVVIAKRKGRREVVLFGNPRPSSPGDPSFEEVRHSVDGYVVRARVPARGIHPRPASYLRFAPLLLALAEARPARPLAESVGTDRQPPEAAITRTPAVLQLFDEATRIARTDLSVLVLGESGTGKELLARQIHSASLRAKGPFVAVNCAGLPHDLIEAELFGVERGAATGVEARPGKFELAHGGTLLLDEIADMAPQTQAMILRTLEDGAVHRVGSTKPRPVSLRVVAATNRDIDGLLREGLFREDLYFRIASWVGHLPPLRDRPGDIPHLVAHFLSFEEARWSKRCPGVTGEAMDALCACTWPGNIRQLKNEISRAYALVPEGRHLSVEHLNRGVATPARTDGSGSLRERLQDCERRIIERELARVGGDVASAARRLDVPLSTLYRRLHRLSITRPCNRRP